MRRMGFEPMRLAPRELESRSLTARTSSLKAGSARILSDCMIVAGGNLGVGSVFEEVIPNLVIARYGI